MKNKINKSLILLLLLAGSVLFLGGCTQEPSQNININSNENTSDTNTSGNTADADTPEPEDCIGISEDEINKTIQTLPKDLQDQFTDETITYSFTNDTLTFKGSIKGSTKEKERNLLAFIKAFEKFRGKSCIKRVLFKADKGSFEWNPGLTLPQNPTGCDVIDVINKSSVKDQIGKNLFVDYKDKVLEIRGQLADNKGKENFWKMINDLVAKDMLNNGCITKIKFVPEGEALVLDGFGWTLCEAGLCECSGVCVNCPCAKLDDPNINTNGNANNSNSP